MGSYFRIFLSRQYINSMFMHAYETAAPVIIRYDLSDYNISDYNINVELMATVRFWRVRASLM